MAKHFTVNRFENGVATEISATRKEVLGIFNDVENRPDEFKGVSPSFSYFNFHYKSEGGFSELLIRLSAPVSKDVVTFVNTVFAPSRSEHFDNDLVIRQYRTPKKRIKTKKFVYTLLNELVKEEDPKERERKKELLISKVKTLW